MRILLTGGCGFIGSAVVRNLVVNPDVELLNIDSLAHAGSVATVSAVAGGSNYYFWPLDILDGAGLDVAFKTFQPDCVMHLAAETRVDGAIDDPARCVRANVIGTFNMLEAARRHVDKLRPAKREEFLFHHVSTDEVFGALKPGDAPFNAETPYNPGNPYAASKAASDHLARAWGRAYGMRVSVSNTTNNYGPFQFPGKLIPLTIIRLLMGEKVPVYGNGAQRRDWIYVEDHAEGLVKIVMSGGQAGNYFLSGRQEYSNLDVVLKICRILDELRPRAGRHEDDIEFVQDGAGHDFRHAMDPGKSEWDLGWKAAHALDLGLLKTVSWYLENRDWWSRPLRQIASGRTSGPVGARSSPLRRDVRPSRTDGLEGAA